MTWVDRVAAVLLLLLAAMYYRLADDIEVGLASDLLGPQYFPRLLAIALAIASTGLLVRTFFESGQGGEPVRAEAERLSRLWVTLALTTAYLLLLPRIGFLILTPVFLGTFTALLGYRRPLPVAGTAVGVTLSLYVLFARMLGVRLPPGLLDR